MRRAAAHFDQVLLAQSLLLQQSEISWMEALHTALDGQMYVDTWALHTHFKPTGFFNEAFEAGSRYPPLIIMMM